ncbi:MAG: addiction module protein [Verrucomicrobiota bacterium]|nr:addiction module protein [Verrucomicrobiota bacterium]
MTTALQELETLSVPERAQIVENLWDSIARSNANLPVPQWQKDELARRFTSATADRLSVNFTLSSSSSLRRIRIRRVVYSVFHCNYSAGIPPRDAC